VVNSVGRTKLLTASKSTFGLTSVISAPVENFMALVALKRRILNHKCAIKHILKKLYLAGFSSFCQLLVIDPFVVEVLLF
jgi:hypothetical protein